ncbi:penicillin-binding protein [Amycolatopsis sp. NBRC 101858]|uniref:transglycosylase domain-containing protein n=1 Tax=Amycolatopsis sp. NBRC 101858 TaxID=3032200 RepID=UPI00249FB2BB|nr:transglycosylase domain-containing protein [Amycolatopsis sp. NBRC 101858]GLY42746.1 penicillin-binding protein [Amycolatopsis sp. NBRC 101858]
MRRFRPARLAGLYAMAGVLLAGVLAPPAIAAGLLSNEVGDSVAAIEADLAAEQPPLTTTVTDRDGQPIAVLYDQYRLPVTAEAISPAMKAAVIAVEDRRFYDEGAVDPRGVLRALANNAAGGDTQGASTITQQYVKNFLINVVHRGDLAAQQKDRENSVARKLREAKLAVRVDRTMSKDEILAAYLNVVQFSGRVYGVAAAAEAYFGTSAAKLTVPQAALLAGMVNSPSRFDPYAHPDAAKARRDVVLDAMADAGSLPVPAAREAKATALGVLPGGPRTPAPNCLSAKPEAGFFCAYAVDYLERHGFTPDRLATAGLTIRTTLDPKVAEVTKQAVSKNVHTREPGVAGTMAVIRPGEQRHEVLAMVANRDYGVDADEGERSTDVVGGVSDPFGAGSVFKIFTAAAALEAGEAGLRTPLPNPRSDCFTPPEADRHTRCYPVANLGTYPDPITLADALATSPNVAFVGLEQRVGVPAVLDMARRLGLRRTLATNAAGGAPITDPGDVRSKDPRYGRPQAEYFRGLLSFTLGTSPVSPLELANVSATLMSGGVWCPPDPILSVTGRDGAPVPVQGEPCERVVPKDLADTLRDGLSEDTVSGTSARAARVAGWDRPDFGKTGTTQDSRSVAFVGGVNDFAVSSLVFADGPAPRTVCPGPPVHLGECGHGAFGGTVAAPPYFRAMERLLAGEPDQPVPPADPRYLRAR